MNYHAALAHFPKITYSRYKKLLGYFSNLEQLWDSELDDLIKSRLEENIAYEFIVWREKNPVEKIEEQLDKEGIYTISLNETGYPRLLAEIADPPHTLFIRGRLPNDERPRLAVVGTRRHSLYGRQVAQDLVATLARRGLVIVSGLALGIDGLSHEATLSAGGQTIAVLGSGIDRQHIYPASHKQLAERIIVQGGAIISEYPPGFIPTQYSFPARNRIIAGLALGTLVIEAPEESGALITAKCALDYNREVFVIPHQITSPQGAGGNNLLKQGATPVTNSKDITNALNLLDLKEMAQTPGPCPTSPAEATLLNNLSREPQHIDAIAKISGLDSSTINSTLILMEMKGWVRNLGGMMYIKNN